jgi:hypothetical protein
MKSIIPTAITLVTGLFTAIDNHTQAANNLNITYTSREAALVALRSAGYTKVQDGRSRAAAKKTEVPNDAYLVGFFNARFLNMVKARWLVDDEAAKAMKADTMPFVEPTKEQLAADCKQQISALNYYLKEGKFTTNAGRDKAKDELFETAKIIHAAERKAEAEAKKAADAKKALLLKANREAEAKANREAEAALVAQQQAEAEAEAALVAQQQAEALEAAKAIAVKKPSAAALKLIAKLEAEAKAAEAKAAALVVANKKAEAEAKAEAELLAAEVLAAASDAIKANKQAEAAAAEVKRLQAEADKKTADKKTKVVDAKQLEDNFYKSIISQLSEDSIESLINRLTMFLDLN